MKKLVIIGIVLLFIAWVTWSMLSLAQVECSLCLSFQGQRHCTKALGPDEAAATEEAHRNACAVLAQGVTEAVACGRSSSEELACRKK